jgi:type IV secretory pathway VirB10-like protein
MRPAKRQDDSGRQKQWLSRLKWHESTHRDFRNDIRSIFHATDHLAVFARTRVFAGPLEDTSKRATMGHTWKGSNSMRPPSPSESNSASAVASEPPEPPIPSPPPTREPDDCLSTAARVQNIQAILGDRSDSDGPKEDQQPEPAKDAAQDDKDAAQGDKDAAQSDKDAAQNDEDAASSDSTPINFSVQVTAVSDKLLDGNEEEGDSDAPLPGYLPLSDRVLDDDNDGP